VKRWVVRAGDGSTVGDVLARMKEDARAVAEGRVFKGNKRVTSDAEKVTTGDEVRVGKAPKREPDLEILFQESGLVACVKPAGIPTVPDQEGGAHALVTRVASQIGEKDLRVTSRLDRDVSGVVIFALDAEAEARLKRAREEARYVRRYVAIAQPSAPMPDEGAWDAPIGRGKDPLHRAAFGPDAKPSATRFRVVARAGDFVMLAVEPQTGRTHQIRVHASHAGAPLLGDRDYGGAARVTLANGKVVALARIALHAARVSVPRESGAPLVATARPPDELLRAWAALGGGPEAWDTALS
jgi:23S rRNA pseudouridine1911/1915/1917 synthase